MDKQYTNSPSLGAEMVRATPSTLVASISAAITSWFGLQHYAPKTQKMQKIARGANGEKLIVEVPELLEHMRTILHKWKAPDPKDSKNFYYSVGDVLDEMEKRTTEYGLTAETKKIQAIRKELPAKFPKSGFDPLADKTRNADGSIGDVRRYVRKQITGMQSELFEQLKSSLRSHVTDVEIAKNKIGGRMGKFSTFQHAHNEKVIKRFRNPLSVGITGAVALGTLVSHIAGQREKQSMVERLEQLESASASGEIQR